MKVTVYIPTHNYGKYIDGAVQSVLCQTMNDWELVIIDDGSTDNTTEIINKYTNHPKIRVLEQSRKGLNSSNNIALRLSNAKYFMRLDADDYLDENALLVLSNILDAKPDVGLVYPDYYLVDDDNEIIEVVRRKKIGEEAALLDLAPHGACTMFRKECLLELGGYSEEFSCQDGYDLWLRFLQSFKPYNVNIPLFYYRQHPDNLTKDKNRILKTRASIKRLFVERLNKEKLPKVLAVIPVVKKPKMAADEAFRNIAGRPLIWHTINEALEARMLDKIVVSSNDEDVLNYCKDFEKVLPVKRPQHLTHTFSNIAATLKHTLDYLKEKDNYVPDAVMTLYINSPLRKRFHIEKSIDTMIIFNVDTVIAVSEEIDHLYHHEKYGLTPINKQKGISLERKAIYRSNGAICLTRVSAITKDDIFGKTVGHIAMLPEESIRIRNNFDLWLVEKIITQWKPG